LEVLVPDTWTGADDLSRHGREAIIAIVVVVVVVFVIVFFFIVVGATAGAVLLQHRH